MKNEKDLLDTHWCFALINGKLGEIYFDNKKQINNYCYINISEYSKKELKMIEKDIEKNKFTYKKGILKKLSAN